MSSSMEQGNLSNNDPNSVYYGTPPNEYPLFQNYQLIGDSQLVRFSEVFLSCKRVFFPGSSGRVGYCVSGQRAAQLATHLSAKLWPVYKNVILMIGTNDILNNTDHTEWKASIESILDLFVKYSVRNVIVCTVPPVPKLWHTVQHWTLLVEYNEILKSLEPKHKGSFSSFKLLDITHFFLSKDAFESFYCNRSDLYVISPIVEGMDTYDETFMMTNVRKQWSNSLNNVTVVGQDEEAGVTNDRSYLKQNISLFDIVNIRYKLLNCFNGSTNDQDDAINKDRFDLIGVTPTDVRHIKSNMLQIGNVEYMYTLRHAFQKFLSHLNRDRIIKMKRMSTSDGLTLMLGNTNEEAFVPLKMARPNYDRPSNEEEEDLESSGVYCRRLDTTTVAPQPSRTPYSNIWGAGRNKEGPDNDTQTTPLTSRHQLKRQHPSGTSDVTCLWAKQEIKRTPTGVESDVRDNKEVVYDELTQGISVKVTNEKDNKTGTGNVKNETSKLSMNLVPRPVMLNQSNENLSDKTQTAMKRHGKFLPRVSESEAAAKTTEGLIKNIEDSNTSHNLVANEGKKFKNDSLCIKIVKETPNQTGTDKTPRSAPDRSASQTPNNGNYATLSQDANEETPSLLNIEYLTPEEKREQESRLSKKALCDPDPSHRDRILQGYDRSFLTRSNTIQLYQYIHSVCQYESKYNEDPMDDKIFYAIIQNLRSGSDVENKLYTSMFGRIEFYKFMKYISLSYIMPKMFSNGFKNVMFTSLVNDNCNVQSYVVKNLDTSMFERHFSRLPGTPANKTPRVDLVHLNQKGFELLKTSLTEVIVQIRQETGEDANIRLLKTSLIQTITQ
uniref:OSK domain-containing protein n=1 Tax=Cacopsylla melanoneura TaxID=428564 RepID=A0A8D8RYV5_9HEMI